MVDEDKNKKKSTSNEESSEDEEVSIESGKESESEEFSEEEDFRIDLSGFSGERQAGVLHSDEKPRNLESQVEEVPIQDKKEKRQGIGRERGEEIKQDLYSEAQLYNEQIKKYQDEITINLDENRRGGKLERESIITPKKAEGLIARPTELMNHENFREDYVEYESKNIRGEREDPFAPKERKHKEDVRKYIAKGR